MPVSPGIDAMASTPPILAPEIPIHGIAIPATEIKIRVYQSSLDRESWDSYPVWSPQSGKDGIFVDANDRPLPNTERLVGDLLMTMTGG